MKKEYVVSRIEASQDGSPYVYITFADPNDYKAGAEKQQNPLGPIEGVDSPSIRSIYHRKTILNS
jgi:hypothetical protein